MSKNSWSGYFLALTAIFFWSFNLIIASYFATSLEPFEIAFGRWFVASLILVPMAWTGIKQNFSLLLKSWKLVISLAITGIVLDNTLIYYAGRTASAINMGLLDVTGPIFLVILSRIFLKTPISLQQILGLIIAVFGVIVIILQGDLTQLRHFKLVSGDLIMLFNTFCFAVYSLLQAKRPPQISQSAMLGATAVAGVIIIVPFLFGTVSLANLKVYNCLILRFSSISEYLIRFCPTCPGTLPWLVSETSKPALSIICFRCSPALKPTSSCMKNYIGPSLSAVFW